MDGKPIPKPDMKSQVAKGKLLEKYVADEIQAKGY